MLGDSAEQDTDLALQKSQRAAIRKQAFVCSVRKATAELSIKDNESNNSDNSKPDI